jgi:general secretion pathway protein I
MRSSRSQAGFTLLEMLGATALLAIGLGILLSSMSQSMRSVAKDEVKTRMGLVARSLISETSTVPLQPGVTHGERDGIDWRLECSEQRVQAGIRLLHLRLVLRQASAEEVFSTMRIQRADHELQL